MKSKLIKLITLTFTCILCINTIFAPMAPATYADNICNTSGIPEEVKAASGCSGNEDELPNTIVNILNAIIAVSGLVAVVFVVVGGVQYMTSAGDAGKVKKAKDTILYAVLGMVVCVLAFAIVNFVISNIITNNTDEDEARTPTAIENSIAFSKKKL